METFEIHITGDKKIIDVLNILNIKNIEVELLNPDLSSLRTEYMSSVVKKFKNLDECIKWVNGLCLMLEAEGVNIIRRKIESPYYVHYLTRALYLESHWKVEEDILKHEKYGFPLSRNVRSNKILATDRISELQFFNAFKTQYENNELEMCLVDTYVSEDYDWFEQYAILNEKTNNLD